MLQQRRSVLRWTSPLPYTCMKESTSGHLTIIAPGKAKNFFYRTLFERLFPVCMSRQLPRRPLPDPRTHRLKGPICPTSPAFGQDLFHPPGDSHLLVRGNDLAIMGCVRASRDTRMDDLERGRVCRLGCDGADDFLHLFRGEHRGEGQVATDRDNTIPAGCAAQRRFGGPQGRHPDGDARRLERAWQELCFFDMISAPFVAVRLAAP